MSKDNISSNFNIRGQGQAQESETYGLVINADNINDVYDLAGTTPFDDLLTQEEREAMGGHIDFMDAQREAIGGLLSYLFKPINNLVPSPTEIAIRCFILVYSVRPELIGNMSLSQIGDIFGTSRQTMSARLIKNDKALKIRAKSRKTDTARAKFRRAAKDNWDDKKAIERYERQREYDREYKSANKEKLREQNNEYYIKNRIRILAQRRKNRKGKN